MTSNNLHTDNPGNIFCLHLADLTLLSVKLAILSVWQPFHLLACMTPLSPSLLH
jgi:hypothetical protein